MGLLYALKALNLPPFIRQMVLGTDNQEKDALHEDSSLMAPKLLVLPSCIQTCSNIQKHPLHQSQLEYVP